MATIKTYTTKGGQTFYELFILTGRDPLTNQPIKVHRRGFRTKKEATLAASRITLKASEGDLVRGQKKTFAQVYEEWYAGYVNTVRESTYARTRGMFDNHILQYFGKRNIQDITAAQLQRAVNLWAKEATRNYKRWFNYVAAVLEYAVRQGYISLNPAKRVLAPKRQDTAGDKPENFWDKAELETFFSYLDPAHEPEKYTLFRVLAFGGLRRGECLALTWNDIDFTAGTIRINKTLTQGVKGRQIVQAPKTRKGRRTVSMDAVTMAALKRWRIRQMQKYMAWGINTNQPDQLVFATRFNTHKYLNQPEKWLKQIEDAHSIQHRITVHGFRHSHASALFAAGATIKEVQERLGHEDVQTTLNVYTHVTKNQNEEAVEKLTAYLDF
ncbi:site-specific integrase [Schleiferilactobacillus harbinensis]|uniref:site-specific integrase n=1 Tax=Schleiferilactobacillus harbinensis TaxID=304207 RepID=UPI001167E349|nr:site-specific integrase [Schleiferilactobacillus harbinensis]GEK06738.1 site-specific integrase [Schleiferilactobacillus harbinensis]